MTKFYAGIGCRKTPDTILAQMTQAAAQLEDHDLILRSGAADGADSAFERGVGSPVMKEIFLPWKGFNGHQSRYHTPTSEAYLIAAHHHPAWHRLSDSVRALMARNVHQVLGASLQDPVKFVLCWTPNGDGSGGTGQTLRVARTYGIPIFDMGSMTLDEIAAGINPFL